MIPPWPVIQLFFSGALQKLLKGLSAAAKWLVADWRNAAILALALFGAWHHFILNPRMNALLEQSQKLTTDTQTAFVDTIVGFTAASAKAQAEAEANAARVKAEQERITDATLASYRADLGALRARYDRLRARDTAAIDPRHPDPSGLPAARDAAGRAAEAPGEDRLPAPGLSLDDALIASEQALQLGALIDWVEAQSAVRFTPAPERK